MMVKGEMSRWSGDQRRNGVIQVQNWKRILHSPKAIFNRSEGWKLHSGKVGKVKLSTIIFRCPFSLLMSQQRLSWSLKSVQNSKRSMHSLRAIFEWPDGRKLHFPYPPKVNLPPIRSFKYRSQRVHNSFSILHPSLAEFDENLKIIVKCPTWPWTVNRRDH